MPIPKGQQIASRLYDIRLIFSGLLGAALLAACVTGDRSGSTLQARTLHLQSQRISYYESSGNGPSILLVHGNSSSARVFRHQLQGSLANKYHIVAIDLPGHGNSDPATGPAAYTLPGYAATLVAIAKALDMEDAVFAGWSLGGHIVLQAQAALPKATGFVVFGTPPLGFPPAMEEAFLPHPAMAVAFKATITEAEARAFATASLAPHSTIDPTSFIAEIQATDGNARAGLAASITPNNSLSIQHADEIEVVRHLTVPLAIFHGETDQLVNRRYIESLDIPSLWRDAVQIIPNAGHTPQWEQAAQFDALLDSFVAEVN